MAIATNLRSEDALLSFLPLIYVVWSDGSVSPDEVRSLAARVEQADLEPGDRNLLADWLDPEHPPRVGQLQLILLTIQKAAAGLPDDDRRNLAELGLAMARRGQQPSERTATALRELEKALGMSGEELARELVGGSAPSLTPSQEAYLAPTDLTRYLDGDYAGVRQQVRAWLEEPRFSREPGLDLATYRERVWSWCQELAQRGLTRRGLPQDLGGDGDSGALLAGFQTLAHFDVSLLIKLGVQVGLFGGSILNLGTERHRPLARQAFTLELPGCFAMTERDHGSNVKDLRTTARYEKATQEFVIHTPDDGARKEWIGNAGRHARMATVFAQLEIDGQGFGVHAFLVPIRDAAGPLENVRIEDCGQKLGLNGVDNGKIWFSHVRIPRDNLLDRFAQVSAEGGYTSSIQSATKRFFTMIGTLVLGRVSLSAASASAAKTGVALAVQYGARRRQFGPAGAEEMAVLDYQSHQRRLMPALATCYALDFASRHLIERFLAQPASEEEARELEVLGAGLKAFASWETMKILQTCRECCGGNGYLWANRFADLKADLDVFTTFEGDNTVLMQLVARGLLTGYRQQFSELKFSAVLKYLVEQAGRVLSERNPLAARATDKLRDPGHLRGLFKAREDQLLVSVARRLKAKIDRGTDSYLAFNECQDHLLNLSRAHIERMVHERFQIAVDNAPGNLKGALQDLCDLFALTRIHEDRAWFLEHGLFEPVKSKAVRNLVLELCARLRGQSLELVNGFGIPKALLDVPMLRECG